MKAIHQVSHNVQRASGNQEAWGKFKGAGEIHISEGESGLQEQQEKKAFVEKKKKPV